MAKVETGHFERCLRKRGYKILQVMKKLDGEMVAEVFRRRRLVVKMRSKNVEPLETEIQAYRFFAREENVFGKWTAKLVGVIREKKIVGLVITRVVGKPLIEMDEKRDVTWWKKFLKGLIKFCGELEKRKILHNDLWDANVLVTSGGNFKVVDFEYMHDYGGGKIFSPMIVSVKKSDQAERERLGWSEKFHSGGDVNQIMGILANDYVDRGFPAKLVRYVKKNVNEKKGDFPFAVGVENKMLSPKNLMRQV